MFTSRRIMLIWVLDWWVLPALWPLLCSASDTITCCFNISGGRRDRVRLRASVPVRPTERPDQCTHLDLTWVSIIFASKIKKCFSNKKGSKTEYFLANWAWSLDWVWAAQSFEISQQPLSPQKHKKRFTCRCLRSISNGPVQQAHPPVFSLAWVLL